MVSGKQHPARKSFANANANGFLTQEVAPLIRELFFYQLVSLVGGMTASPLLALAISVANEIAGMALTKFGFSYALATNKTASRLACFDCCTLKNTA
jgi:hypothetical protein